MAKKKVKPSKTVEHGLGYMEKLTVQKSKPLYALWKSDLTLSEFKILDTYLGRINSHDDEHRTVKFEKGELESLLGIKQIKADVLDKRLDHLMTTIHIPDDDSEDGFSRISLFEKIHAKPDKFGVWEVELTCTESAKQYIFNIENIGYLRYKLRNIVNIKSRYSYIMFLYIWENKFKGTWEVSVDELKFILDCDNEEYCNQFKVFNDRVLKRIHKEIHEVTDISYDYETVKRGRSVVAIRFIYHSSAMDEELPGQISMAELEELKYENELELWKTAIECFEFTDAQYDEIHSILVTVPEKKLPFPKDAMEIRQYHYLDQAAKEIIRRDKELKPIKNKFLYLKRMIRKDSEE